MLTRVILLLTVCFCTAPSFAAQVPRTLIALYDSREESTPRTTRTHRFLEMPANYLGYRLSYHDINAPLPPTGGDIAGIVVWLNPGAEVPDANAYLAWLDAATAAGKNLIVLENLGLGDTWRSDPALMDYAGRILSRIGVKDTNRWQSLTYGVTLSHRDKSMVGFERAYENILPSYMDTRAIAGGTSHLSASFGEERQQTTSDLVITSPRGGYVAAGYAVYTVSGEDESQITQWYINPFAFLRTALNDTLPKADVTTMNGMRVFFAQIDSDGFNGISDVPEHRQQQMIGAEVVKEDIIKAHPDIPFTVGLTSGEIDPACYGLKHSQRVASEIFALPNVEPASHSRSHPLFWRFFATYDATKEEAFRKFYPSRPIERSSLLHALFGDFDWAWRKNPEAQFHPIPPPGKYDMQEQEALTKYYKTPRSMACEPFDLASEITGSATYLRKLLPTGKSLRLFTWSGDTTPFEAAIAETRSADLLNINGGEARVNPDYPSATATPPIGLTLGSERQIYASNANEFTYASSWGDERYSGFRAFERMTRRSETPLRLKPLNLYFHMDVGLRTPDLAGVRDALSFIEREQIIPVTASTYAEAANGFFTLKLESLGPRRWQVLDRGGLQTLRFDRSSLYTIDFDQSSGVIGQQWWHGSLYVALDPGVAQPVVALKKLSIIGAYEKAAQPYLIRSHWVIKNLHIGNKLLTFTGSGFGAGTMLWRMSETGTYRVTVTKNGQAADTFAADTSPEGMLDISIKDESEGRDLTISIGRVE